MRGLCDSREEVAPGRETQVLVDSMDRALAKYMAAYEQMCKGPFEHEDEVPYKLNKLALLEACEDLLDACAVLCKETQGGK